MPVSSAAGPSSRTTRVKPSNSERSPYSATVCCFVLTTSTGVASAWDMLAHSPPAKKYRSSCSMIDSMAISDDGPPASRSGDGSTISILAGRER
eukprot:955750-Prymnesium_polylepis.1